MSAYWEVASFFLLAGCCSVWERLRPGWRVDQFSDLPRDLLSFAIAVLAAWSSRDFLIAIAGRPVPTSEMLQALRGLPFAAKLALGLVAVDFCVYWIHRAQHYFTIAWRTHCWHHSAEQMYWLAGFRTSLAHSFAYNVPQTIIPLHLLDLNPVEAGIGYSIGLFVQFWDHANARARIGCLKYLFIRPQDHRLHHAVAVEQVVNFGFIFCLWDRCFGTYGDGDRAGDYCVGLGQRVDAQSVPRMLLGV